MRLWHDLKNARQFLVEQIKAGEITGQTVEAELAKLHRQIEGNRDIAALSQTAGWRDLDQHLSQNLLRLMRDLPDKIIDGKKEEALVDAIYIKVTNGMLALVNKSAYETELSRSLINDYAEVYRRRKAEEENAGRPSESGN